jgi:hypothetical protein
VAVAVAPAVVARVAVLAAVAAQLVVVAQVALAALVVLVALAVAVAVVLVAAAVAAVVVLVAAAVAAVVVLVAAAVAVPVVLPVSVALRHDQAADVAAVARQVRSAVLAEGPRVAARAGGKSVKSSTTCGRLRLAVYGCHTAEVPPCDFRVVRLFPISPTASMSTRRSLFRCCSAWARW